MKHLALVTCLAFSIAASFPLSGFSEAAGPVSGGAPVSTSAAPAQGWVGFYAGLSATSNMSGDVNYFTDGALSDGPWSVTGSQIGVFAGYNHQIGLIVLGGEVAYGAGDVAMTAFPEFRYTDMTDLKLRVGYGGDRLLPYAFAGYTVGTWDDPSFGAPVSASGMMYGLGMDIKLTDRLFAGVDYTLRDLTSDRNPALGDVNVSKSTLSSIGLRIGLNF
ncbi:porin family protein [uncultured Aliiroseovarius sp.]|uniref:outer membrane protein n=1 Tax=uncultured Aliiroseovarius sp. TaxID=1658783 RepID=UPI0025982D40|nr:porin family protein [uncultured Aliiroseovarius sp.]